MLRPKHRLPIFHLIILIALLISSTLLSTPTVDAITTSDTPPTSLTRGSQPPDSSFTYMSHPPLEILVSVLAIGLILWLTLRLLRIQAVLKKELRLKQRLQESEEKYRSLVESTCDCLWEVDEQGRFTYLNPNFQELTGYTSAEFIGRTPMEFIQADETSDNGDEFLRALTNRQPCSAMKHQVKRRDGRLLLVEVSGVPLFTPDGSYGGMRGITRDITQRKQVEDQLRMMQVSVETASDEIYWITPDARIVDVNSAVCRALGYTREELFQMSIPDIDPHYNAEVWLQHFHDLRLQGSQSFETEHRCKDGRIVPVEIMANYVKLGDQERNCAIVRDISHRKRTERELLRSRDQWERTFDAMPDLIFILDADYRIRRINQTALNALGIKSLDELNNERCSVCMHGTQMSPALCPQAETLKDHKSHTVEILVQRLGRHFQVSTTPIFDDKGNYLESVHVAHDVTESKQYEQELEKARETADAANRAKSDFLSNMSHEIRTPMNAVLGLAQLLEAEQLSPDQLAMVQQIRASGRSLLGILNDILDFSKIEAGLLTIEQRPFALSALLTHITTLTHEMIRGNGLNLQVETPAELLGYMQGDSLRLEQILINLLGNAVKFTRKGTLILRIILQELTESSMRLRFEVQDSGVGISPEVIPTLFKPFIQADGSITRRFGGTGLGLSICRRLVELMGGEIGVVSEEGVGSTFWFEIDFQRTTDIPSSAGSLTRKFTPTGSRLKGLQILVADDNEINRSLASRALKREGAIPTLASDGEQALTFLKRRPHQFDAVLMDIQMPVVDGLSATRTLRLEFGLTELPIIAFTAGVLSNERQKALDAGINDFLPKPIDLEEMVAVILRWTSPHVEEESPVVSDLTDITPPQVKTIPAQLPGLDITTGIENLQGDENFYREMVGKMLEIHGDDYQKIKTAVSSSNLRKAAEMAHTLKGVASNLAVITIFHLASELEIALKNERMELLDRLLPGLEEALIEFRHSVLLLEG